MVPWGEGVVAPFARTSEIRCPLMFHFGEEDTNPSLEDMRTLDAALTRDHKEHVFYTYPNAGHAFMVVAGLRFDTSGRSGPLGTRWQPAMRSTAGFVARHPPGL